MSTINELSMRLAAIDQSENYQKIMDALIAREQTGIAKYGTTVDRDDLSHEEWIQEGIEELLDAMMYFARAGRWEVIPTIYQTILDVAFFEASQIYEKTQHITLAARN